MEIKVVQRIDEDYYQAFYAEWLKFYNIHGQVPTAKIEYFGNHISISNLSARIFFMNKNLFCKSIIFD